jgi:ABC-type transporter Mla subunit MlaD
MKVQSRGTMEFQEENVRNVDPRDSAASAKIAEDMSSLGDKAKSNIADAAETAKAHARRIVHEQKDVGADRLGEVAGAVHGAARTLEAGMPQVANYVHEAAAQLEDVAKTLRHRSVDDLIEEIGSFARSQPALFFGGAMLAGFALTRFLKSSGDRAEADPRG